VKENQKKVGGPKRKANRKAKLNMIKVFYMHYENRIIKPIKIVKKLGVRI
jgi:hypothetical protein